MKIDSPWIFKDKETGEELIIHKRSLQLPGAPKHNAFLRKMIEDPEDKYELMQRGEPV